MFCPNCGAQNKKKQNYCRYCGLSLQDIEKSYLNQLVFGADTKRLKNSRTVRKAADSAQYFSGVMLFVGIITSFFSDSAMGKTLITASLLSFFLVQVIREVAGYFQRQNSELNDAQNISNDAKMREFGTRETNKLIEEKPFIPVSSITEGETELLYADKNSTKKF